MLTVAWQLGRAVASPTTPTVPRPASSPSRPCCMGASPRSSTWRVAIGGRLRESCSPWGLHSGCCWRWRRDGSRDTRRNDLTRPGSGDRRHICAAQLQRLPHQHLRAGDAAVHHAVQRVCRFDRSRYQFDARCGAVWRHRGPHRPGPHRLSRRPCRVRGSRNTAAADAVGRRPRLRLCGRARLQSLVCIRVFEHRAPDAHGRTSPDQLAITSRRRTRTRVAHGAGTQPACESMLLRVAIHEGRSASQIPC